MFRRFSKTYSVWGTSNNSVPSDPREDHSSDETKYRARGSTCAKYFVKYDGKDSADSSASGFFEVPFNIYCLLFRYLFL